MRCQVNTRIRKKQNNEEKKKRESHERLVYGMPIAPKRQFVSNTVRFVKPNYPPPFSYYIG